MAWFGTSEAGKRAKRSRSGARRRARVKAAATNVRALTLDEVYARDNGWCHRCRRFVPREQASIDHVVPLSKGGADDPENQRLCHRVCNSQKGARTTPRRKGLRRTPLRRKPRDLPEDVF